MTSTDAQVSKMSKRDTLLEVATELFRNDGFHATGIDAVLKAAGVAKMTLYNQFGGKDGLILEVLRSRSEQALAAYASLATDPARDPFDRVLDVFDAAIRAAGPGTGGCLFMHASAEYAAKSSDPVAGEVRGVLQRHQDGQERVISEACRAANVGEPGEAARQLNLLLQGLIAGCSEGCAEQRIASARAAAEVLLERYAA